MLSTPLSRRLCYVAVAALALSFGIVVQDSGPNQAAHFALVRALSHGTSQIDPTETIDAALIDGRYHAAKAPGLAFYTLPWYEALQRGRDRGDPRASISVYRSRVWALTLWGSSLPALALVLLMFVGAERVAPGYGAPAAVLLTAGTVLLPFSTLFFNHMLSAALGFAAFSLLVVRHNRAPPWMVVLAGACAGLAVVVEFTLVIVAAVLAALIAFGRSPARRLAAYTLGVCAGLAPLVAYNTWAFGSPTTLGYANALTAPAGEGPPQVGANASGFYGVGAPDFRNALSLLFSEKGLAVVCPIAVIALVGLPLLWRAGRRAETVVCAAVPGLFLAFNAGYYLPFGGQGPGPRFLVPAIPFLVLPLAVALRARPLVVGGLGVLSTGIMALATATSPLTGVEYGIERWLERLAHADFAHTIFSSLALGHDSLAVAPFLVLVGTAIAIALLALPLRRTTRSDCALLVVAVAGWVIVATATPDLLPADSEHGTTEGLFAVVVVVAAIGLAVSVARASPAIALVALLPAAVLIAPPMGAHPRWSLILACSSIGGATLGWLRVRHERPHPSGARPG